MTKEERLKYLHSKHIDKDDPIGEIEYTSTDIEDELSVNHAYQEHKKTSEKKLTADE